MYEPRYMPRQGTGKMPLTQHQHLGFVIKSMMIHWRRERAVYTPLDQLRCPPRTIMRADEFSGNSITAYLWRFIMVDPTVNRMHNQEPKDDVAFSQRQLAMIRERLEQHYKGPSVEFMIKKARSHSPSARSGTGAYATESAYWDLWVMVFIWRVLDGVTDRIS